MASNKRYAVGSPEKMQELFPQYSGRDERQSIDGKLSIYEVNLSDDELSALKRKAGVKLYVHEDVLALLSAKESAGIWYPKEEMVEPKTKETLKP